MGTGAAFEVSPPSTKDGVWEEQVTCTASYDGADGYGPMANLTFDAGGNLYGTALGGRGGGTIFRLSQSPTEEATASWAHVLLYSFGTPPDAGQPEAPLIFGEGGVLYGTTVYGGSGNQGAVFKFVP